MSGCSLDKCPRGIAAAGAFDRHFTETLEHWNIGTSWNTLKYYGTLEGGAAFKRIKVFGRVLEM